MGIDEKAKGKILIIGEDSMTIAVNMLQQVGGNELLKDMDDFYNNLICIGCGRNEAPHDDDCLFHKKVQEILQGGNNNEGV